MNNHTSSQDAATENAAFAYLQDGVDRATQDASAVVGESYDDAWERAGDAR